MTLKQTEITLLSNQRFSSITSNPSPFSYEKKKIHRASRAQRENICNPTLFTEMHQIMLLPNFKESASRKNPSRQRGMLVSPSQATRSPNERHELHGRKKPRDESLADTMTFRFAFRSVSYQVCVTRSHPSVRTKSLAIDFATLDCLSKKNGASSSLG